MSQLNLTDDEKRQVLYASLLRYSPETVPLRNRALERVVLGSLLGTHQEKSLKTTEIQSLIKFGEGSPLIRNEVIRETLAKLVNSGRVSRVGKKRPYSYYIIPEANEDLIKAIKNGAELFDKVLTRLLKGTGDLVRYEIGATVCRTFICECFARFGKQFANTITGRLEESDLVDRNDVEGAFSVAVQITDLTQEAIDSLRYRCLNLLRSREPIDRELIYHLINGYYITQLLGMEDSKFNPLAEKSFTDAIFYLDTNMILFGILHSDELNHVFQEIVSIAKRNKIELRITRATLEEMRNTAKNRSLQIKQIISLIPEPNFQSDLAEHTSDKFFISFLNEREKNHLITTEEFFKSFENPEKLLKQEWGIIIEEKTESDLLKNAKEYSQIIEIIQEEAKTLRGRPKPTEILNHDLGHYLLIIKARKNNAKTWFLTNDQSLIQTASRISNHTSKPFCVTPFSFLQSISPFLVSTQSETTSLADVVSAFLTEQIPVNPIFDIKEITVLAEVYEKVEYADKTKIMEAFDSLRHSMTTTTPLEKIDTDNLALELRKILATTETARRRELQDEINQLRSEKRKEVEQVSNKLLEVEKVRAHVEDERRDLEVKLRLSESEKNSLTTKLDKSEKEQNRQRLVSALFSIGAFFLLWYYQKEILEVFSQKTPTLQNWADWTKASLVVLRIPFFVYPTWKFIKETKWKFPQKFVAFAIIIIVAFASLDIITDENWSKISSWTEIACLLATLFIINKASQ